MFQILDGHGKGVQGSHYFLRTPTEDAKCAKALVEAAIGGNVPWPDDGEDEPIVMRPPPALEDLEQARGPPRKHMKSFASPPRFLIIRGHRLLFVESHGPFSQGPRHVWSCLRRTPDVSWRAPAALPAGAPEIIRTSFFWSGPRKSSVGELLSSSETAAGALRGCVWSPPYRAPEVPGALRRAPA